ncbi:Mov34/MPN/PAD-1 family protein [Nitrospina gracilis]|uniref:Mov34/MPN/PAD-1 family protein n=1 Tax=Nitrospina gracilis TaxID=35801 RepID=UPI001F3D04DB|nr:Mov34/MPN/PAD-1 family protein [Nitrospina gracilis]MCF8721776.1 integrative and conjugative element protein (TIGR02256 family) [Nitrospina gracilis Nb-211]
MELSAPALATLNQFRQLKPEDREAGGMLLGRMIEGTQDVIIDEVTCPHPSDSRNRFTFFRKKKPAQRIVEKAWEESRGTNNYLGEWHSHPEQVPSPSLHDLSNWKAIGKSAHFEQGFLIFIIVGQAVIKAWILCEDEVKTLVPV